MSDFRFLAKALLISSRGLLVFLSIISTSVSADMLLPKQVEMKHRDVALVPIDMATGSGYSVSKLAHKFIKLNCQRCHEFVVQRRQDRPELKNLFSTEVNNKTNSNKVLYLHQYLDLEVPLKSSFVRVFETHFNNNHDDQARNQGVYLSRMLAVSYARDQAKKTPHRVLSWWRSLFGIPGSKSEKKIKAPYFGLLKLEQEFFDISGANANQGVEFLSETDFVFANG